MAGNEKFLEKDIEDGLIKHENKITKISLFLLIIFSVLSPSTLLGAPALVGLFMSLGLYFFPKIRRWERNKNE